MRSARAGIRQSYDWRAAFNNHQQFEPFGGLIDAPSPELTRIGFTGHQHDQDLGLIDMRGRMYDPLAGRFMSPDPFVQAPYWSQGQNPYAYVFNDPINATDPSGFLTYPHPEDGGVVQGGGNIQLSKELGYSAALVGGTAAAYGIGRSLQGVFWTGGSGYGTGSMGAGGIVALSEPIAQRLAGGDPFAGTPSYRDATYRTVWNRAANIIPAKNNSILGQNGPVGPPDARPPGTSLFNEETGALAMRGARRPRGAPMYWFSVNATPRKAGFRMN